MSTQVSVTTGGRPASKIQKAKPWPHSSLTMPNSTRKVQTLLDWQPTSDSENLWYELHPSVQLVRADRQLSSTARLVCADSTSAHHNTTNSSSSSRLQHVQQLMASMGIDSHCNLVVMFGSLLRAQTLGPVVHSVCWATSLTPIPNHSCIWHLCQPKPPYVVHALCLCHPHR